MALSPAHLEPTVDDDSGGAPMEVEDPDAREPQMKDRGTSHYLLLLLCSTN